MSSSSSSERQHGNPIEPATTMPDGIENPSFLESFVDEPLRFGLNRVDLTAVKVPVSETGLVGVCLRWHRTVHRIMQLKTHPEVEDEKLARLYQQISKSFGVMFDALDRYDYHELSLSYNGGKDCLVLLILYLAAVGQHIWQIRLLGELDGSNETFVTNSCHGHEVTTKHGIRKIAGPPPPESLASVYIAAPSAFPQLTGFVETSASKYHLQLASYATKPQPPNALSFRQAFVHYLQDRPQTKAILVGTRRTDPNGANLGFFDRTDGKWREEGADFMRVHPVIEWEYDDVWRFLRLVKEVSPEFGWCELYDRGYTSLGGKDDTRPNPQLREEGSGKGAWYRPAWELQDGTAERAGRNWP